MAVARGAVAAAIARFASGLRFPKLVALTAAVFVLDLLIPDVIPFADEILLGLVTLVLAGIRRRDAPDAEASEAARPHADGHDGRG